MQAEFDGLGAAGAFAEIVLSFRAYAQCCVDYKWLLKWKGDQHGMIDVTKSGLVAKGYGQVEGVDYFDMFAPTCIDRVKQTHRNNDMLL